MLALRRRDIVHQAWPMILAGASVPLLGMVDTAVIGHFGDTAELGALALGALLFNFIYWGFGFLRMSTTGFVAQASGAGDVTEVRAVITRAVMTGVVIGVIVQCLQFFVAPNYFALMDASADLMEQGQAYFHARIWGAPAALALYGLCGALIGLGRSRELLVVQLVLNGLNAGLDIVLAGYFGMGVAGIGIGTAIAEWLSCVLALALVWRALHKNDAAGQFWPTWGRLLNAAALRRMCSANADILVRTVCLLAAFGWFARQGAQLGEDTLAANHLLLQLVAFCAFFLDGFAHVVEAQVGVAVGRADRQQMRRAIRLVLELSVMTAAVLAAIMWMAGGTFLAMLTDLPAVLSQARAHLPWVGIYVLVAVHAFVLDGVFIGATQTRPFRNAAVIALLGMVVLSFPLLSYWEGAGLWAALVAHALLRTVVLLPALKFIR